MQKDHYKDKNNHAREVKRKVKLMKTTTAIYLVNHLEEVLLKFMKMKLLFLTNIHS